MSDMILSPYVRRAWDHSASSPWSVRPRTLWDYELLYIKEGQLLITIEDITYEGIPGDLFLFKPGQRHSIRSNSSLGVRQPHIHFDLVEQSDSPYIPVSFITEEEMNEQELTWFRPDLLSVGPFALPNRIRLTHPAVMEQMLFDLIHEYHLRLPYYHLQMKSQLLKLLTYLIRERHWSETPQIHAHQSLLLSVRHFITEHTHTDISLDELSTRFHISKYYLTRLFRDAFHMSPIQYHQTVRIEKAKQLIQFTGLTIQSIADQLGYANIHTFSRAFKNKEGVAPSNYRLHERSL
ncbi:AraC family transcriptional regulator [Paenibacillus sp. H1-7]|uniref:AraC family transcriptional regulator n=1 Tax=Paenibacillus sp. H1-7 TaxID=2282849 RepID=UPI001EF7FC9D|nr:helix-turn-helix domain-containing protein [Paenibacillus sp. H1-7]ULL13855.1 AraC family transcriptional regulator [Paenibacillus sp. H1-7]